MDDTNAPIQEVQNSKYDGHIDEADHQWIWSCLQGKSHLSQSVSLSNSQRCQTTICDIADLTYQAAGKNGHTIGTMSTVITSAMMVKGKPNFT